MNTPNQSTETSRTVLTTRAINLLLPNKMIKDKIAEACGVTYFAVHRWVQDNDPKLTQADAMRVIRDQTGMTDDQILTTEFTA